ncbi:hypothetical protein EMIHUDRAFT_100094 [Emiliania huxleyi CCMP1516]|uniref:Uncharacterized protein n=2 Tax=Emiliania huxleyi TaxID=2903 RepID=A0A0D3JW13_EMIH1|nr:hypothetical protein EMIHUDRAFT_100094 [Emiliania huxleyi CCMP1516]EOD27698.1 hypothetical protein EMIHUDRAFT_100094 [Emiliania huxleyi CCMP1516]|eukprot:XP_005780127.1 hypothetical protein EMIHUDRAFT_100094 [Emiliania huxleyi CCMP1516]
MGPQSEYTHVQFLGFNLLTIPGHDVDGCSHPETGLEGCYLGSEDIQQDVERRIEIMTTAMQSAYAEWKRNKLVVEAASEPQVKTLKLFVVPEFFWRGSRGVYSFEEVWDGTLPIVDRLREAAADSKFEDWLFFFGTIVMSKPTKGWFGSSELAYKNVMPIMKGGPEGKTWLVEKHTISSIDFIKVDPAFGVRKPCGVGRCSVESQEFNEQFDLETTKVLATAGIRVVKDNVFEVDGLLVGVEICLDHNRGTEVFGSRTALEQKIDELKTTVDVQVIASAGMSIEWGPVAVTRDGPVFMADGFGKTEVSFNRYGLGLEDWHNDPTAFIQVDVLSTNIYHQYATWIQVSALGNGWRQLLKGTFPTAAYDAATEIATVLNRAAARDGLPGGEMLTFPTIDVYSPTPVQARRVAAVQPETFVRTLPPPRSARALRVGGDFFSM